MIKGIATSGGIVIGKAFKYVQPKLSINEKAGSVDEEKALFKKAIAKTVTDIEKIKEKVGNSLNDKELAIFDAHLMMVNDPEYLKQIEEKIDLGYSAAYATKSVSDVMIQMFESMDDSYFKERSADIKDVSYRLLCNILGVEIPSLAMIDSEVIIVANEMTPSDTAQLDKQYALGFATEIGGKTSHAAIMAASLGIPAVVGANGLLDEIDDGETIILDAINGVVINKPTEDQIAEYQKAASDYNNAQSSLKSLINAESISKDGHKVEISANIGSPKDIQKVIENGADGIGLYRTEFLYMESIDDFPDEDTQFEAYKVVLEKFKDKKVVIRTLDIGGDKKLDYFNFEPEMNPFLGYRAIRLCLDLVEIFRTQIRALLRASVYGKLAIMFPMIATIDEFKTAKQFVLDEKKAMQDEGIEVSDDIEIGMMVEIPAAAVLAEKFAKYADFFSIGTNDLIQYSMAADRMSEKVAYLYQPLNPSILRLIKMTIDGAHANGKWCGMCGEMGGDPMATPILLGLGLDEFSMSAASILRTRNIIRSLNKKDMEDLAKEALAKETVDEVVELVKGLCD